jgi:hypothetical protein
MKLASENAGVRNKSAISLGKMHILLAASVNPYQIYVGKGSLILSIETARIGLRAIIASDLTVNEWFEVDCGLSGFVCITR